MRGSRGSGGSIALPFALVWSVAGAHGCFAGDDPSDGGQSSGPCSEGVRAAPAGEVELGTGYESFEPLGDQIPIIAGPQGGFHLNLNARIRGLDPGDPGNLLDPDNPRTFFRAYDESGEHMAGGRCPVRWGYREEDGGLVLFRGASLILDTDRMDVSVDHVLRVEVEILDSAGYFAFAESVVTALAPPPRMDAGSPGQDAGAGDAGPDE